MKSNQCLSIIVLLGSLLFLVGAANAGVPLQTKPANINAFLGKWEGTWNHNFGSGGAIAEISRLAPDTVRFQATILRGAGNADAYEAPAKFSEGELNVDLPTLTMVFGSMETTISRCRMSITDPREHIP